MACWIDYTATGVITNKSFIYKGRIWLIRSLWLKYVSMGAVLQLTQFRGGTSIDWGSYINSSQCKV